MSYCHWWIKSLPPTIQHIRSMFQLVCVIVLQGQWWCNQNRYRRKPSGLGVQNSNHQIRKEEVGAGIWKFSLLWLDIRFVYDSWNSHKLCPLAWHGPCVSNSSHFWMFIPSAVTNKYDATPQCAYVHEEVFVCNACPLGNACWLKNVYMEQRKFENCLP